MDLLVPSPNLDCLKTSNEGSVLTRPSPDKSCYRNMARHSWILSCDHSKQRQGIAELSSPAVIGLAREGAAVYSIFVLANVDP